MTETVYDSKGMLKLLGLPANHRRDEMILNDLVFDSGLDAYCDSRGLWHVFLES